MKIGINCLSIKPKYLGGVTTFTFGIINGLINLKNDNYYQIYVSKSNAHLFNNFTKYKNVELILCYKYNLLKKIISNILLLILPPDIYKKINSKIFYSLAKLMDSKSDIIYTASPTLINYNNKKPTLVSMHDIQHFHYPEYLNPIKLIHRKKNYFLTAKYSDFLQASSIFIKNDFLFHYPFLDENKILIANEGVIKKEFIITNKDAVKNCIDYQLPEEFIFYPAQLWYHKNHVTVIKAIKIILDKYNLKINLVFTGEKFSASKLIFKSINDFSLNDQIYYLGKVPFKDIVSLYKLSKYFITATSYESSSLPALEAAATGTAIIASDTPPNIEMSELLEMNLFESENETSLSETIYRIWYNEELRENQIKNNFNNIDKYSWNNMAIVYNDFLLEKLEKKYIDDKKIK